MIVALVAVAAVGGIIYIVRKIKAKRGTSTIVKTVSVTTIANPVSDVSTTSATTLGVEPQKDMELATAPVVVEDETKI